MSYRDFDGISYSDNDYEKSDEVWTLSEILGFWIMLSVMVTIVGLLIINLKYVGGIKKW